MLENVVFFALVFYRGIEFMLSRHSFSLNTCNEDNTKNIVQYRVYKIVDFQESVYVIQL